MNDVDHSGKGQLKNSCDVPEWPAEGELAPEQN